MSAHVETWRFRIECQIDASWIFRVDWCRTGLRLIAASFSSIGPHTGDMEGSITVEGPDDRTVVEGLRALAYCLDQEGEDLHVLVESLKPDADYDGQRNGPFAGPDLGRAAAS